MIKRFFCFFLFFLASLALKSNYACEECSATNIQFAVDAAANFSSVLESITPSIESLCSASYTTKKDISECIVVASEFIHDLHRDLNSETEHESEIKFLTTEMLCSIISACGSRCCISDWNPEQIHLASTLNPSTMIVSWVTLEQLENPVVQYWKISDEHSGNVTIQVQPAVTSTYTAGGWLGTIYNCTITNLQPGTAYRYRIYGVSEGPYYLTEKEYHFITDISPSTEPLASRSLDTKITPFEPGVTASVVAYAGDFAILDNSRQVAESLTRLAQNKSIQMVIQGGDLAYADTNQTSWDLFFRMIESYADTVPVMAAPGNHENYYHFDAYYHRYFMTNSESLSSSQQYFSFNYEKIHFIVWSFEELKGIDLRENGKQRSWLENDLQQANSQRDVRPWIILIGHRPFYCSADSNDCQDVAQDLRELLEDLLNEYHVDVVLQAHKHNYERTYPVYQSKATSTNYTDPAAPMYYVVGTGGRDKNDDWQTVPPLWSADRDTKYGYLLMSAPDENTLEMVYLSKSFTVHDKATIVRTQPITDWIFPH